MISFRVELVNNENYQTIKYLVDIFHYSRLTPPRASASVVGFVEYSGIPIAGCLFSYPSNSSYNIKGILELSRLVRVPWIKTPLSSLISKCRKTIRCRTESHLLISYADGLHGHHGGVYQASSWFFHGERKPRIDSFLIDGKRIAARTCNHLYNTSSISKLKVILGSDKVIPLYGGIKYLYWVPLNKKGISLSKELGFNSIPYPKPFDSGE